MFADALRKPRKDAAQRRQGLDDDQLEEVREAFNLFDSESNGTVDVRELKATMRALGFQVKKAEIREMLSQQGVDEDGSVSFAEFCDMVKEKMNGRDTRVEILKIFALFDEEGKGKITFKNLKKVAQELGEDIADEDLKEMVEEADRNGDGAIDQEEFYRVMKKRGINPLDDLDSDED